MSCEWKWTAPHRSQVASTVLMDSSLGNPVCFYRITFHAYRNASFLISYLLLFRCSMGIFPMNHDNTHTLGQESSVLILLLFQQHRPLVSAIFRLAPNEKSTLSTVHVWFLSSRLFLLATVGVWVANLHLTRLQHMKIQIKVPCLGQHYVPWNHISREVNIKRIQV